MCKILWLVYNFKEYCEAQGKGRSKGRLRKVTQRSFIDYRFSIIDIHCYHMLNIGQFTAALQAYKNLEKKIT